MAKIRHGVTTATALALCAGIVLASNTNADLNSDKAASAAAIATLEKSAYEAWKSKDATFWRGFLSDKFIGWGSTGRLDKASAMKEYSGEDCDIKSYALSDEQVRPLGKQAALITYKVAVNGTCGGENLPAESWAAGLYRLDGDQWQAAFHAQAAVVDPKALAAMPVDGKGAQPELVAKPALLDARTNAMLAIERQVWDAWKEHDAKKLDELMARDISFINIFGTHLATKAEALKNWSGVGCDVKSVRVTDAAGTALSPTVGILTFKGSADGTCYGQTVGSVWGTSIYVKDGAAWKWSFGINVPAQRMGIDPSRSVVDPFDKAPDMANLFIVDGSNFVTSARRQPTATIQALAYRASEHIVSEAKAGSL